MKKPLFAGLVVPVLAVTVCITGAANDSPTSGEPSPGPSSETTTTTTKVIDDVELTLTTTDTGWIVTGKPADEDDPEPSDTPTDGPLDAPSESASTDLSALSIGDDITLAADTSIGEWTCVGHFTGPRIVSDALEWGGGETCSGDRRGWAPHRMKFWLTGTCEGAFCLSWPTESGPYYSQWTSDKTTAFATQDKCDSHEARQFRNHVHLYYRNGAIDGGSDQGPIAHLKCDI